MSKTLIVATRGGALAETQTGIVVSAIQKIYPSLEIKIRKIVSEGDKDRRTTLWELKETGFFTSQLEDALMAKEADVAVHSFKDLPTEIQKGLSIGAVCSHCVIGVGNGHNLSLSSLRKFGDRAWRTLSVDPQEHTCDIVE